RRSSTATRLATREIATGCQIRVILLPCLVVAERCLFENGITALSTGPTAKVNARTYRPTCSVNPLRGRNRILNPARARCGRESREWERLHLIKPPHHRVVCSRLTGVLRS